MMLVTLVFFSSQWCAALGRGWLIQGHQLEAPNSIPVDLLIAALHLPGSPGLVGCTQWERNS